MAKNGQILAVTIMSICGNLLTQIIHFSGQILAYYPEKSDQNRAWRQRK